jgi:hypothetical protein
VLKSRKRSRNEMEVDDSDNNNDVVGGDGQPPGPGTGAAAYGSRQLQNDSRSSKRYHREHRRSVDNISNTTHEDGRM